MTDATLKGDLLFSLRHPLVRTNIVVFVMSMLLLAVVGSGYWWPTKEASESLRTKINDKRREIFNAGFSVKLAQVSGRAAQQVGKIESKLVASTTQAVLVQNLEDLAHRHNVKIISEAYEEGKSNEGYSSFVHELTLQAAYPDLRSFISGLQKLPTFTIVQEAMLGRSSNSHAIKAQLNLITYRRMADSQP